KTGMNWHDVPEEIGASGQTCWRRMREWTEVGVWDELHRILLDELNRHGKLDLSLAVVDSSSLRALQGGRRSARTRRTAAGAARSITSCPTPRGRPWSRRRRRPTCTTAR